LRILIALGVPRQKEAGAAGVVLNHARELEKLGHNVECWFLDDILQTRSRSNRFEALSFARAVAKRIRRDPKRFDVVNIHAPWGCVYGLWRKYRRPADAPAYVLTMQGSEERYVQMMKIEERKGRATNFNLKNRLWHRLYHQTMYDFSIRTADYGAVANREAWICAELKYGREPGRIWYVPNATEERFFSTREFTDKSSVSLLYVGTWLERKGIHYLAQAFEIVSRKNLSTKLTVAGCTIPAEEVKKYFAPDIRERVSVIPFVTREDIPAVYAAHDVFVFPSLVEGMPLTLLEAMAAGMPVITTNTCGMADIVEDGFNGLLVPPADSEKLASGIEALCGSRELREQLGLEGQRTARRYTWAHVTLKLEQVFVTAAKQNGRAL
jgi:glycosyltransferase involved in cell wall biosynthesis